MTKIRGCMNAECRMGEHCLRYQVARKHTLKLTLIQNYVPKNSGTCDHYLPRSQDDDH